MSRFDWFSDLKYRRRFLNPERVSQHLRCSICQDIYQDPVRTACGHTFCYICIENWASSQKSCPLCKSPFRRKLEKDLIALNIIDDLDAACVHPNCQWTGSYAHVKRHQRLCVHRPRKPQEEVLQAVELQSIRTQQEIVDLQQSMGWSGSDCNSKYYND